MVVMETLFDLLSATGGAIFGAIFAFFLNRRRNRSLSNQLIISRQALDKIKLENDKLLTAIHEKENMINKTCCCQIVYIHKHCHTSNHCDPVYPVFSFK